MKPTYRDASADDAYSQGSTAVIAVRLADAYPPPTIPTVEQLRDRFGMSRATAYRWRASFKHARGAA